MKKKVGKNMLKNKTAALCNAKFKLSIIVDGKEIFVENLSHLFVYELINLSNDILDNDFLFKCAAHHSAASVRACVAWKNNISKETFDILASDSSLEVLRRVANNQVSFKYATQEQVNYWIGLDLEIAKTVAENFQEYFNIDIDSTIEYLLTFDDPEIIAEVAKNRFTPKKFFLSLINHTDSEVTYQAKRNIAE